MVAVKLSADDDFEITEHVCVAFHFAIAVIGFVVGEGERVISEGFSEEAKLLWGKLRIGMI